MGGAIFDNGGRFSAKGCTFWSNSAQGGTGGASLGYLPANGAGGSLGPYAAGTFGGGGHGGGNAANGGPGGFGGGGGGGGVYGDGPGGFGGGGAGGGIKGGQGGFGGGHGGASSLGGGAGGGGAGLGGGIFCNQGSIVLVNDTFTANTAAGGLAGSRGPGTPYANVTPGQGLGGAVFCRNGTLVAIFDTFSGNTAARGGTDVYVLRDASNGGNKTSPAYSPAKAELVNDIFGQSSAPVCDFVAASNDGASPPVLVASRDFISNNPAAGGLPGGAVVNAAGANPQLGPLADNGGPTETMAPLGNSSVRATGVTIDYPGTKKVIAIDQRGIARNFQHPDLGAFEVTLPEYFI
jgi:hypothetical protein